MAHLNKPISRPHSPRHGMDKTIRQRGYNSKEWAHTRAEVMRRDMGLCQRCLRLYDRVREGSEVHHITPLSTARTEEQMMDLLTDMDNCVLLCAECHHEIHNELKKKGVARW